MSGTTTTTTTTTTSLYPQLNTDDYVWGRLEENLPDPSPTTLVSPSVQVISVTTPQPTNLYFTKEEECLRYKLTETPHPLAFRTYEQQAKTYTIAIPTTVWVLNSVDLSRQITELKEYINLYTNKESGLLFGFDPIVIHANTLLDHPIHKALFYLCKDILNSNEHLHIEDQIDKYEEVIIEILHMVACGRDRSVSEEDLSDPALLPKIELKIELIEIALRNHLFLGLTRQDRKKNKEFFEKHQNFYPKPSSYENGIYNFVTNCEFYAYPPRRDVLMRYDLEQVDSLIDECVQQNANGPIAQAIAPNEALIDEKLINLRIKAPSLISTYYESNVREKLTQKMISEQTEIYKAQFEKDGKIDKEQLEADALLLIQFNTTRGEHTSFLNPRFCLLIETFRLIGESLGLDTSEDSLRDPNFPQVIKDCVDEGYLPALQQTLIDPPTGFFSYFTNKPDSWLIDKRQNIINKRYENQWATLNWAQQEWRTYFAPPAPILPSAPIESGEAIEESTEEQDLSLLPIISSVIELEDVPANEILLEPVFVPVEPAFVPEQSAPVQEYFSIGELFVMQPLQPKKITANDLDIPLISYINLAFGQVMNKASARENWNALPDSAKKDALRHVIYYPTCEGKAEEAACALFQTIDKCQTQLGRKSLAIAPNNGMSPDFNDKGDKLLKAYYSEEISYDFAEQLEKLPKEPRFYQYVYELAVASGVHIESWDREFAKYNWNKIGMKHICMQAIERCLHTSLTN